MFSFLKKKRFLLPLSTEKNFHGELDRFNTMLQSGENFALVRFGDGEMTVINGDPIDLSKKCNGEHRYIPGEAKHEEQRERLKYSLRYQAANYYVGIACPCCVGEQQFLNLKRQAMQPETHLTWANIFVNSNFERFRSLVVPALARRKVVLVCHRKGRPAGLPFTVVRHFGVGPNAWLNDYDSCLNELTCFIRQENIANHVFLFSAGVLSNILICELHQHFPNNTYLDIGSVFDVELGLGMTRRYLKNSRKQLSKTCVWI
ncbi:MAG: hypothetical protein WCL44_13960 [bacterium]